LSFVRDMGGDSGNKFQIIHALCFSAVLAVLIDYLALFIIK